MNDETHNYDLRYHGPPVGSGDGMLKGVDSRWRRRIEALLLILVMAVIALFSSL